MERRDWWVYPWQVDAKVAEWQRRFPQLLRVDAQEQYTRHRVWAITVADKTTPDDGKARHLVFVPHAHEPAGTAACMSLINQLLTGKHSDGCPSTLRPREILERAVLTFIPDGNPYGRSRCPEPVWEGDRFNNREFINMVFGIGDQRAEDTTKPRWERFKRVDSFSLAEEAPARLGLVYEPVDACTYVEPNRGDPRSALVQIVDRLSADCAYDHVLGLHQTEFEGYVGDANCMVILPGLQDDLLESRQVRNSELAETMMETWRQVGGRPTPMRAGRRDPSRFQRQAQVIPWEALQRGGAFLTVEIQNNCPRTLAEQQLLLMETAMVRSIAFMLGER